MAESLLLKWGTVKDWEDLTDQSIAIMNRYFADGVSMSCAMDHPDDARRAILCELIDQFEGAIHNDWGGVDMTKEQAKKYVTEYGRKKTDAVLS